MQYHDNGLAQLFNTGGSEYLSPVLKALIVVIGGDALPGEVAYASGEEDDGETRLRGFSGGLSDSASIRGCEARLQLSDAIEDLTLFRFQIRQRRHAFTILNFANRQFFL